ncbi:MAG: hypothetical protein GVY29_12495 [Spirochaetes bacterium]|jgi:hypothetical protein|nr:hypothetical protein [Spirochaetota bacterium]
MSYILVLLADWANGIFAVVLAAYFMGTDVAWWHFLIGIVFSHGPDIDALPELWRRGQIGADAEHDGDHRDGLHYPLALLAFGGVAAWLFGYWGLILFFSLVLHLVNDLYGTGWGIKLFWPFSSRQYKLLGRRVNMAKWLLHSQGLWDTLSNNERRLRLLVSWEPAELPTYMARYGDPNWMQNTYMRINWISGIEYALFLIAVVLVIMALVT